MNTNFKIYYANPTDVKPLEDYKILVTFDSGEKKIFDVTPYFEIKGYERLRNKDFFKTVHILYGAVAWNEDLDLCPEDLYDNSELIANS
ncbi:hypothetical protein FACS189465_2070 [Clostridia bacterium]|nr:hypothetical protein FACS189465_2070 [Clostridia bacterium]